MAKKRISSIDFGWLIVEQLKDSGRRAPRISLERGWRVVLSASIRRFVTVEDRRSLLR